MSVWEDLKSLERLDLSRNPLTVIPEDAFASFNAEDNKLNELSLASTNLSFLPSQAFMSLRNVLETLDLSENEFNRVPHESLQFLQSLQKLNFSGSKIKVLPTTSFPGLKNLNVLDMSKSRELSIVESNAFDANPGLGRAIFDGCENLASFAPSAFSDKVKMDKIY